MHIFLPHHIVPGHKLDLWRPGHCTRPGISLNIILRLWIIGVSIFKRGNKCLSSRLNVPHVRVLVRRGICTALGIQKLTIKLSQSSIWIRVDVQAELGDNASFAGECLWTVSMSSFIPKQYYSKGSSIYYNMFPNYMAHSIHEGRYLFQNNLMQKYPKLKGSKGDFWISKINNFTNFVWKKRYQKIYFLPNFCSNIQNGSNLLFCYASMMRLSYSFVGFRSNFILFLI